MTKRDPSTASNYDAWVTRHSTADLRIDFEQQRMEGHVVLEIESLTNEQSTEIVLDSSHVSLKSVFVDDEEVPFELDPAKAPLGSPVRITLPIPVPHGQRVKVKMGVSTTSQCSALQWLKPNQTSNKKAPFMFSQAQACHGRSLFPCQDTPDVKSTFTFRITSKHAVVASGVRNEAAEKEHNSKLASDEKLYCFEQKVPIPSYLFALASGDIATAKIGPRSVVATSPDKIDECVWELENDVPKYMDFIEKLIFPYRWGDYNVLVLPPSFPYGGMENPIYTFATPTIISGDRQNVEVIAHEMAHSWSGNLVTSGSWEHYWLNEGWTMYIERRTMAHVLGDAYFDFSAIIGWKHLEGAINDFGADSEFTQLCIPHKGIDPDDAFSTVPYEKGFHMVWYLDRLVGRANFDKFIPHYFTTFANKSLDSFQFKDTFLTFFRQPEFTDANPSLEERLNSIDWDSRFYSRGLPPKPEFNTSMVDVCYTLSKTILSNKDYKPRPEDVEGWVANQKLVMLGELQDATAALSEDQARALGEAYGLTRDSTKNVELQSAYYQIAMRSGYKQINQDVAELLGTVGRMKYVRPLFSMLNKVDRELALATFERNKMFYHPICRKMVAKDLGVSADE